MNARISRSLRKLASRRYGTDPNPRRARVEYRAIKRDWLATPRDQRAKTLAILDESTFLIEAARADEAAQLAAIEAAGREEDATRADALADTH